MGKQLQANAHQSFTAFKAVLTAYHAAIRSILSGGAAGADVEPEDFEHAPKSRRRRKRVQQGLMQISDEAVFSAIIEWTLANIVDLLQHHGGASQSEKNDNEAALDPTTFARWSRVKVLASIFWDETHYLLNQLGTPEMLEYLLRNISNRQALVWLWPFRGVRRKFFGKCCSLWCSSGSHQVRLLAFLFIRNAATMSKMAPKEAKPLKQGQTELEALIRMVLRAFAEAASAGYSWRSVSTFRFMENCYLELLRIDDATAYRVGYVCIRQLALILRNANIAASQAGAAKAAANQEKQRKRKGLQQQQVQNLASWSFVRGLHLWTKAVGALPCLKPLAYPLATITAGALKSRVTSVQYFPFVYHCIRCLNRLGASIEVYIPIAGHLLKALSVLLPALDRTYRGRKANNDPSNSMPAKAPEIDVLLKFPEGQAQEAMTLEAVGGSICFLLIDHLGIMSRSPSFPELAAPVLLNLRQYSKRCRSDNVRGQLRQIVVSTERSVEDIIARREALSPDAAAKAWKSRLFLFEADSPIARTRMESLARKEREERRRVDAEMRPEESEGKRGKDSDGVTEPTEGKAKRKKSKAREHVRQKAKRKLKAKEEESAKKARDALSKQVNGQLPGKAREDVVEEMGFSSGDEE